MTYLSFPPSSQPTSGLMGNRSFYRSILFGFAPLDLVMRSGGPVAPQRPLDTSSGEPARRGGKTIDDEPFRGKKVARLEPSMDRKPSPLDEHEKTRIDVAPEKKGELKTPVKKPETRTPAKKPAARVPVQNPAPKAPAKKPAQKAPTKPLDRSATRA